MARTVPVVALQNPNTLIASALWNSGPKAMGDFYVSAPMFRGRQLNVQSTSTGVWTAMILDRTSDVDTENGHSTTVNPTRYTCQVPGWYWAEGFAAWQGVTGSNRTDAALYVNGVLVLGSQQSLLNAGSSSMSLSCSALLQLAAGDYVEVFGRQNSGGTISTAPQTDLCPVLNLLWVRS